MRNQMFLLLMGAKGRVPNKRDWRRVKYPGQILTLRTRAMGAKGDSLTGEVKKCQYSFLRTYYVPEEGISQSPNIRNHALLPHFPRPVSSSKKRTSI